MHEWRHRFGRIGAFRRWVRCRRCGSCQPVHQQEGRRDGARDRGWGRGMASRPWRRDGVVRAPISGARWRVHRDVAPISRTSSPRLKATRLPVRLQARRRRRRLGWLVQPSHPRTRTPSNHSWGSRSTSTPRNYLQGQRQGCPANIDPAVLAVGMVVGRRLVMRGSDALPSSAGTPPRPLHVRRDARSVGRQQRPVPVPPGTPSPTPTSDRPERRDDMVLRDIQSGAIWGRPPPMHHLTGPWSSGPASRR